jgi:hypothetical protein
MLHFNGLRFAKNDAEMIESLFSHGGTCAGFYKRLKSGFQLLNLQKELFAFLVDNKHGEKFVVTASRRDGKAFYMYGSSAITERLLGLDGMGYMQQIDVCKASCEILN